MRAFLAELKRRNVYKVAVAYAAIAWLLIQVTTQTFPFFEIPNWAVRLVVLLLVIGFPIALVIAWAFELTPEGIKRTDELPRKKRGGRAWLAIAIAAAVLSVAVFFLGRYTAPRGEAATAAKSIAVLPFENRSEEKANAYLADGIQDEILTRLAKIDELKVISRTSTARYKSSPEKVPEIARQLEVEHVLEGSVQKAGDQVRVTVQLIRAATDSHLWAETYDRKLTDIFAVQTDIAENIAKALRAKLTPGEQKAVAAKPTDNPAAYDAYLRGLAVWSSLNLAPENLQQMEHFYSEAVRLDPNFAVAWAFLSLVHTISYADYDPTSQRLAEAKRALDSAMQLQPDLGESYFALGIYRYRALRDYDGALRALEQAIERGVNRAMSLEFAGYVKRRQGKWDETLALHAKTVELDPRNPIIFSEQAVTLRGLRRFAEAHAAVDRALSIVPDSSVLLAQKAGIYAAEGNLEAAGEVIRRLPLDPQQPEISLAHFYHAMFTRRFDDAVRSVAQLLVRPEALPRHLRAGYRSRLGFAKRLSGDVKGGSLDLAEARSEFEALRAQSDRGEGFVEDIIIISGLLGDRATVEAYVPKLQGQIATDAYYGPVLEKAVAVARAQLGDADAAISIISGLLKKPGENSITTALLRADPSWDPLRGDPRFRALADQ